ncbi:hypothetical protein [Fontivita pretiosa]|uniref:hypothetical protein n=1 Tax=Fontivita pretiosa TaxID=2989684 RepID=UPI003D162FE4
MIRLKMLAVAALVAAELQIPAYYQFEQMPQPVFLPTSISDDRLRAKLRSAISNPHKLRKPADWDPEDLRRLEFEGMIRIQRRADGSPSSIKLTPYGRYWAQR